jgi:hypothetical protein
MLEVGSKARGTAMFQLENLSDMLPVLQRVLMRVLVVTLKEAH